MLSKHIENASKRPRASSYDYDDYDDNDDDEYEDDSDFEDMSDDDFEILMHMYVVLAFFKNKFEISYCFNRFLFDLVMKGEAHSHLRSREFLFLPPGRRPKWSLGFSRRPQVPQETEEQFQARVRRSYEEQVAAEERRKQEAAARREEAKEQREQGLVHYHLF